MIDFFSPDLMRGKVLNLSTITLHGLSEPGVQVVEVVGDALVSHGRAVADVLEGQGWTHSLEHLVHGGILLYQIVDADEFFLLRSESLTEVRKHSRAQIAIFSIYRWLKILSDGNSAILLFKTSIISKMLLILTLNCSSPNDLKTHHRGRQFSLTDGFTVANPA